MCINECKTAIAVICIEFEDKPTELTFAIFFSGAAIGAVVGFGSS